jgi:iron complex outermembrane receptor protein
MAMNIGDVVVDRGPGNASVLGDATFGGTVAVQSDDPRPARALTAILSDGSFNTRLGSLRYDTGEIGDWGGTRAYMDVQTVSSDGYLTNANLDRTNAFAKIVQPLGDSTTITIASNLNKLQQNPPVGATIAQIDAFGSNFAYNTDPGSQSYYGYNLDKITTDFEFIGLLSKIAGWTINNKVYTYAYYHDGWNGEDVYGTAPGGTVLATENTPNVTYYGIGDVPGQRLTNNYRSVGDIFRLAHDLGPGEAQIGLWYDHQTNYRALFEEDFSDNGAYNPLALGNAGPPTALNSADRIMHDALFTTQGYLQYVWHATTALDVTAGIKEVSFERVLDATVNQKTGQPLSYNKTWNRDLPSFDAHYKLADNWSVYAQWSKGFLAPNLNVLYTTNPAQSTTLNPESTTNVQAGSTWTSHGLTLSADAYYINFSNLIQNHRVGNVTVFYNEGGIHYRGVEAEGTYVLGAGFSVYGNAAWASAHVTADDSWVPDTPQKTAAIALFYKQGPLQGSLIDHYIGVRYGNSGDTIRQGGYSTTEAAINYTFLESMGILKRAKLGVAVQNIFDNSSLYFWNGTDNNGDSVWFRVPGRSFQVTLTAGI